MWFKLWLVAYAVFGLWNSLRFWRMHFDGDWKMTNGEMREFFEKATDETSLPYLYSVVFYFMFLSPITLLYGSLEADVNPHIEGISFVAASVLGGIVVLVLALLILNFYDYRDQAILQRKNGDQSSATQHNVSQAVPHYIISPAVITKTPRLLDSSAPAIPGSTFTGIIMSVLQTGLSLYAAYLAYSLVVVSSLIN